MSEKQTVGRLWLFLLGLALVAVLALYLDVQRKNRVLQQEIQRLQNSQVLLMVPDAQAEAIAEWLSRHPDATDVIIRDARKQQQQDPAAGTSSQPQEQLPLSPLKPVSDLPHTDEPDAPSLQPVVVSESADGVKVINLPHGGIRVTTREEKH
ncbi:membrane anchored protein in chemotaxis locus [Shewanella cyperi]|nr:membrane anchored protein in chemotaxis locus [Shewanella cyperi]QSX39663.1 membrane anchored protein in chemotaxis locus [Shewanella cyperi]